MKHFALLAAGLVVSGACQAAGLGAAVSGDTYSIYVPVDVGPSLRLEPLFNYSDSRNASGFGESRFKSWALGLGVFVRRPLGDRAETYWGARAAYFSSRDEVTSSTPGFTPAGNGSSRGLALEPTIGASFLVTDRFSISLEENLGYSKFSGSNSGRDVDGHSIYTSNRILLRLMF